MNAAAFQEIESFKAQIQLPQQRKTLAFYNKDHNSENVTVADEGVIFRNWLPHLKEVDSG